MCSEVFLVNWRLRRLAGPFEVVARHDKNENVYRLRKCGDPKGRVTSHSVRDMCPYITKEAHEREISSPDDGGLQSAPPLLPEVGDFLLLPYGSRDFVCRVLHFNPTSGVVKVQFYNNEKNGGLLEKVQPVWYCPKDHNKEVYCGEVKRQLKFPAYLPYTVELHVDEFYQVEIKKKLHSQPGTARFSKVTLPRHLKNGVRKFKPLR